VKDDSRPCGVLKRANAKVLRFVRYEVGAGIEKKQENFAAEVMPRSGELDSRPAPAISRNPRERVLIMAPVGVTDRMASRRRKTGASRILVKLSGEALMGNADYASIRVPEAPRLGGRGGARMRRRDRRRDRGGNLFRARPRAAGMDRVTGDQMGCWPRS